MRARKRNPYRGSGLDKRQARRARRREFPRWQWVLHRGDRRFVLSGPMHNGGWEVEESWFEPRNYGGSRCRVRLHYPRTRRAALALIRGEA